MGHTSLGVGSCWDAGSGHAGGYQSLTEASNDPQTCAEACVRVYGEDCARFDTRGRCLIYTLAGDPSNRLVTTRNCNVNGNLANCDSWSGGTCYSMQHWTHTSLGVGSCWDAGSGHAGGYQSLTEASNDPQTCADACVRVYGEDCAGFDTRGRCLIYTLAGDPSNRLVTTRNCNVNGNLANCDS